MTPIRSQMILRLEHAIKEFDGCFQLLAILAGLCGFRIDGDDCLLEICFLAGKAANPLGLTCAVYGIYLYNLYMEEGFGSLCNFNLVCILGNLKRVLALLHIVHALLGDHRIQNNILRCFHFYTPPQFLQRHP